MHTQLKTSFATRPRTNSLSTLSSWPSPSSQSISMGSWSHSAVLLPRDWPCESHWGGGGGGGADPGTTHRTPPDRCLSRFGEYDAIPSAAEAADSEIDRSALWGISAGRRPRLASDCGGGEAGVWDTAAIGNGAMKALEIRRRGVCLTGDWSKGSAGGMDLVTLRSLCCRWRLALCLVRGTDSCCWRSWLVNFVIQGTRKMDQSEMKTRIWKLKRGIYNIGILLTRHLIDKLIDDGLYRDFVIGRKKVYKKMRRMKSKNNNRQADKHPAVPPPTARAKTNLQRWTC